MKSFSYWAKLLGLVVLLSLLTAGVEEATEFTVSTITVYLAYFVLVATLSSVSVALPWPLRARAVVIFVMVTGAMTLNIAVELVFFSVKGSVNLAQMVISGVTVALLGSLVVAWMFPSNAHTTSAVSDIKRYFHDCPATTWVLRFVLAVSVYVVAYLIIGGIAYLFTEPFYTDGELGLVVPKLTTVILVQFLRGSIYVLSLWLFVIGSCRRWSVNAGICALALFVLGGLVPLLLNDSWPLQLRLYHGVEIFFQNATAGLVLAFVLRKYTTTAGFKRSFLQAR